LWRVLLIYKHLLHDVYGWATHHWRRDKGQERGKWGSGWAGHEPNPLPDIERLWHHKHLPAKTRRLGPRMRTAVPRTPRTPGTPRTWRSLVGRWNYGILVAPLGPSPATDVNHLGHSPRGESCQIIHIP